MLFRSMRATGSLSSQTVAVSAVTAGRIITSQVHRHCLSSSVYPFSTPFCSQRALILFSHLPHAAHVSQCTSHGMARPHNQGTVFPQRQPPIQFPTDDSTNYFGSDDDEFWDNLNSNDIKAAETEALTRQSQWQATQASQLPARRAPSPNYIDDDDEVTEVQPPQPVIERLPQRVVQGQQGKTPRYPQPYRPPPMQGRVLNQPARAPATGGVAPTPSQNNPQYKRPVPVFNSTNGGWTPSQQTRQIQYPPSSQSQSFGRGTQQGYTPAQVSRPTTAAGPQDENDVEALRRQLEEVMYPTSFPLLASRPVVISFPAPTRKRSTQLQTPRKIRRGLPGAQQCRTISKGTRSSSHISPSCRPRASC